MSQLPHRPAAFLTLTLHAHLPYVVNHGTWPHGLEWLLEAAAETYLPLLRMLRNLKRDGVLFRCNLNLTPVLLEQLAHPVFQAEFPEYLERKIVAAREDEAVFATTGEAHYAHLARTWQGFYAEALNDFHLLGGNIISGFRECAEDGMLEILTCCATHGYLPLLGTDESVRAQVQTAIATHTRYFGRPPRGIWIPECGYRPAGEWRFPVIPTGEDAQPAGFQRMGVEQVLSEAGLQFFFVDTHLIEQSARVASPYERNMRTAKPADAERTASSTARSLYRPYLVDPCSDAPNPTTVFARDPYTGLQVWSGDAGYPGDGEYLDFHKKRWPGGHRYWRVTDAAVDIGDKEPYHPERAAARVRSHAEHFVHTVWEALSSSFGQSVPPVLCAPFDAELFGHWWFEGIAWLEQVARIFHAHVRDIELISSSSYLERYPAQQVVRMPEGSWGAGGDNQVWLNDETAWTYRELYAAELFVREVCTRGPWQQSTVGTRLAKQMCREILLLESSDWQFLITTGAARDYAERRIRGHLQSIAELRHIWERFGQASELAEPDEAQLAALEKQDSLFPEIEPELWAIRAPFSAAIDKPVSQTAGCAALAGSVRS